MTLRSTMCGFSSNQFPFFPLFDFVKVSWPRSLLPAGSTGGRKFTVFLFNTNIANCPAVAFRIIGDLGSWFEVFENHPAVVDGAESFSVMGFLVARRIA